MQAELGWSRAATAGAFSVALLVSGVAAYAVGRWVAAGAGHAGGDLGRGDPRASRAAAAPPTRRSRTGARWRLAGDAPCAWRTHAVGQGGAGNGLLVAGGGVLLDGAGRRGAGGTPG